MRSLRLNGSKPYALIHQSQNFFIECFSAFLKDGNFHNAIDYYQANHIWLSHNKDTEALYDIHFFIDASIGYDATAEIIQEIKKHKTPSLKVIVMTTHVNPISIQRLKRLNAHCIFHKQDSSVDFYDCLVRLSHQKSYHSTTIQQILNKELRLSNQFDLTTREIEIIKLFAQGYSISETAQTLSLSKHTVVAHRRNLFRKTNSKNITSLIHTVRNSELIDLN